MGYALAEVACERGGEVLLISGKTNLAPPVGVKVIDIDTAEEMYKQVLDNLEYADIIIKTAAVADYRPKHVYTDKIKKNDDLWSIEMERTRDIAKEIGIRKDKEQFLIGFSAETNNLIENAKSKLIAKNMDMIVANNILQDGAGFACDSNIITIITKSGDEITYPKMSKKELAAKILNEVKSRLKGKDN